MERSGPNHFPNDSVGTRRPADAVVWREKVGS